MEVVATHAVLLTILPSTGHSGRNSVSHQMFSKTKTRKNKEMVAKKCGLLFLRKHKSVEKTVLFDATFMSQGKPIFAHFDG